MKRQVNLSDTGEIVNGTFDKTALSKKDMPSNTLRYTLNIKFDI